LQNSIQLKLFSSFQEKQIERNFEVNFHNVTRGWKIERFHFIKSWARDFFGWIVKYDEVGCCEELEGCLRDFGKLEWIFGLKVNNEKSFYKNIF
jgi:hypothetical protein